MQIMARTCKRHTEGGLQWLEIKKTQHYVDIHELKIKMLAQIFPLNPVLGVTLWVK